MSLPAYTETDVRQNASADSFQRGRDYARDGNVASLVQRGTALYADVVGSEVEPYRVQVTFDGEKVAGASCTCPYDWGGWCKHIVAALLAARERPETVEARQPLAEVLTGLTRDQLQALLLKLMQVEPGLVDTIEAQVPLLGPPPAAIASSATAQPAPATRVIDARALRREVQSRLGYGGGGRYRRGYGGYIEELTSALSEVADQARQLIEAGDGNAALTVLEILTDELVPACEGLDDSYGEPSMFFERLGGLWAEALLTAELTTEERQAWIPKLETWQEGVSDYGMDEGFILSVAAAEQGWEHPPLQRVLRGEITELGAWEGKAPSWADDLANARLNVLDRQGRHQEYLYLAEAEGQIVRYATMLARLGRAAEAVAYGREHLTSAGEAHTLAQTLWDRGEVELALASAEHGLTLAGARGALAAWLRDRAVEQGQPERALSAARVTFEADQNLAAYLSVQQLAGPGWAELRLALLDHLRSDRSYNQHGPVEIFLHEGLTEDAIAVVDRGATHTLVEQVADAASESHPDWVITVSRRHAEGIMDRGKSEYYRAAADWVARARDAYRATGREHEWQAYQRELLDRHHRKRSLVPLLKALT